MQEEQEYKYSDGSTVKVGDTIHAILEKRKVSEQNGVLGIKLKNGFISLSNLQYLDTTPTIQINHV